MLDEKKLAALRLAAQSAIACEDKTGCPAELTIAQWALESGWGNHAPGNNCFGIKYYKGAFGRQTLATTEYINGKLVSLPQDFATFPSLEACFEKHALLITKGTRYRPAYLRFAITGSLSQLVRDIAPIYAPGNTKYVDGVLSILAMRQVKTALGPVMA